MLLLLTACNYVFFVKFYMHEDAALHGTLCVGSKKSPSIYFLILRLLSDGCLDENFPFLLPSMNCFFPPSSYSLCVCGIFCVNLTAHITKSTRSPSVPMMKIDDQVAKGKMPNGFVINTKWLILDL